MGRIPTGSNFEYMKSIKLNEKQVNNWDPKKVKAFLENSDQLDILREMFENGVIKVYGNKLTEEYKDCLESL